MHTKQSMKKRLHYQLLYKLLALLLCQGEKKIGADR